MNDARGFLSRKKKKCIFLYTEKLCLGTVLGNFYAFLAYSWWFSSNCRRSLAGKCLVDAYMRTYSFRPLGKRGGKKQNKTHNHFREESQHGISVQVETNLGKRHKEKSGGLFQDVIMSPCLKIVACKRIRWMESWKQFVRNCEIILLIDEGPNKDRLTS